METVKRRLLQCLLLFLFVTGTFLYAQNEGESNSYLVKTEDGLVIFQTIVFPSVPNTWFYEAEIEQREGTGFVPVQKLETKENQFDVSLKAGDYRYRITAFNKMGILEGRSDWQNFTVRPAVQPEADTYQPFYGLYFEVSETEGTITVTGSDFSSESEFALVNHKGKPDWSGKSLENQKKVIFPDKVEVNEDEVILSFGRKKIKTGNYDVLIRNPGGLWTVLGTVRAGNKNPVDWTFSAGYQPMFALFDIENAVDNNIQTVDRFNPAGYYFRIGMIPLKTKFGNFGLEFHMNMLVNNRLKDEWANDSGSYSRMFDPWESGTINILYQLVASERWQHNARLGAGGGETYHSKNSGDGNGEVLIYFDLGYSAQYFIWKNLYAEAGIDLMYAHNFNMNHGHFMIRPSIGIGWQAGRWADWAEVAEGAARGEDYSVPVKDEPKPEFLLSLGWAPMIPLSGIERFGWDSTATPNAKLSSTEFIQPFNAGGANFRFAYIPYRWRKNKLGFEIEIGMLYHKNGKLIREYNPFDELMFGLRYQRVLDDAWQLNVRAGMGLASVYAYNKGMGEWEYAKNGTELGFKFGASAQYFFWRNLYVEGGIDLTLAKTHGYPQHGVSNYPRLYLKPGIAIGWQFSRDNETGLRLPGMGFQWSKPKAEPSDTEEPAEIDTAEPEPTETAEKRRHEFLLSAGGEPIISLTGNVYNNKNPGIKVFSAFNPGGGSLRFAWLPHSWDRNKLGYETELTIANFENKDFYEDPMLLLLSEVIFGVRYQRVMDERWQLNARAGIGMANSYEEASFGIKFGGSAQFFFWRNLYAEAGLDFTIVPQSSDSRFFLRPSLAIGWQFNRSTETAPVKEERVREEKAPVTRDTSFQFRNEFLLSLGWSPMIPLNGKDSLYAQSSRGGGGGSNLGKKTLQPFNPLGGELRFAWLPFHWDRNTLGFEAEFNMLEFIGRAKNTEDSNKVFELLQSESLLGVRYQRIITDNFYLNARLAAGPANPYFFQHGGSGHTNEVTRPDGNFTIGIKFGGSVQYFFWRNLYGELGLDVTSTFGTKSGTNVFLRPSLAVGWQFGRL